MESLAVLDRFGTAGLIVLLGLFFAFLLAFAFAWFVLPFAVMGVRATLRQLLRSQEESRRLLEEIREELRTRRGGPLEQHGLGPGIPGDPDP